MRETDRFKKWGRAHSFPGIFADYFISFLGLANTHFGISTLQAFFFRFNLDCSMFLSRV